MGRRGPKSPPSLLTGRAPLTPAQGHLTAGASTVAMMINGARPEDPGQNQHTPRAHSHVCPRTHTDAHWPFTHTGGRLRPRLWARGCARAPAHQAPTQAPSGDRAGPPPPGPRAGPPELRFPPPVQSSVWGCRDLHRFPRGTYLGEQLSIPRVQPQAQCASLGAGGRQVAPPGTLRACSPPPSGNKAGPPPGAAGPGEKAHPS